MHIQNPLPLAACCAALALLSGAALFAEASPLLLARNGMAGRIAAINTGGLKPALSIRSQRNVLDDCYRAMTSVRGRVLPAPDRALLLSRCDDIAASIVDAIPTHAYARLIRAYIAGERADEAGLNREFVLSQRASPAESWLAALRVDLAERHHARLEGEALTAENADIALLARSPRGVQAIASRYVADPDFRARVVTVVETLPPDVQRRFIKRVRAAANGPAAS